MTELIVCTTCRPVGASRELPAAGQALLEAVQAALRALPAASSPAGLRVIGVACLSGCSRACTVALQAPGKYTYCFGGLVPEAETAAQVLACAIAHRHSVDGLLPWQQRPERLRSGILVRLPPASGERE
jgi:predicted metal-binding protein